MPVTSVSIVQLHLALGLSSNQVSDLGPLVQNLGIASGDVLYLASNCLDLTLGSQSHSDVQTLLGRGVTVRYESQLAC